MLFPYKGIAFWQPHCQQKCLTPRGYVKQLLIDQLTAFYEEAYRFYDRKRKTPPVHVSFYPYIGINHTIRMRDGNILVRVGEICREMPLASHRGLAYILVGKLFRRKIPPGAREIYDRYIKSDEVRLLAQDSKRERGRKVVTSSKGTVYDLDEIFDRLNSRYFRATLPRPVLTWSARKTYRILGHHDATHDHITISRSLDSADVPASVVDYVLFHEMLHIAHPTQHVNGRRYNHTPAFRRDERKFPHYEAAEKWIERNVRRLERAAKRR